MARLRTEHLLCIAVALYLVTCYYVYIAVDLHMKHTEEWPVVDIKKDKMEKEWNSVDVGYPQYVLTVSGWIQVVDVPSYTAKPGLHVFVVPHSHQDVGWRDTVDSCYKDAKNTLNHAVAKLEEHKNWKFIWAETAYLSRWYNEAKDTQKQSLKRAIADGQLEIVTGGWVMTEEACAHYAPMLDQLIEGHLWLNSTLGVRPVSAWSVDPFGHSPTVAYLLKGSGLQHMVIQRVHFGIKRHLARSQRLEFNWRQSWDLSGATDIPCHMMPFLTYAVLYSCGPDPHVCCQFDFSRNKCTRGKKSIKPVPVSKENIKQLAWALWEQYQKKAQLYKSSVLLVPHGDDFRYDTRQEWEEQLGNMEKLMTYMNNDRDMNIKVEFGTISDYFKAVEAEEKSKQMKFDPSSGQSPVLVGDFFPYNDRDDQYWTGYYTTRPLYKYMSRFLQGRLRLAEVLYTLTVARLLARRETGLLSSVRDRLPDLEDARHTQAVFMHHDAITGTSKKAVVKDYAHSLKTAISKVDLLLEQLMSITLTGDTHTSLADHGHLQMSEVWPDAAAPPVFRIAEKNTRMIVVANPLTTRWVYAVKVHISDPNVRVTNHLGEPVPQQISPVLSRNLVMSDSYFELVFEADMPALSVRSFGLDSHQLTSSDFASITVFNLDKGHFGDRLPFKMFHSTEETFTIENRMIKASFSRCSGTLQHIMRKSDDVGHKVGVKFVTYGTGSWTNPLKDKSGAYIFLPDGPAQDIGVKYPSVVVIEGTVASSVYTHTLGLLHAVTLYNISGPVGAGVHVENVVNLADARWDNKELVMRLVTDIHSPADDICVDLNGFQMNRKHWRSKLLIQGNFHPINTMVYIENQHQSRLSLITAQAHGVASLSSGWLEVVLDRRLMQDDWRGLGEGVTDNAPTPSKFVLLLERLEVKSASRPCRPSPLAHLLSEHLNNPPVTTVSSLAPSKSESQRGHSLLTSPFPCALDLVNLRTSSIASDLKFVSALMVLHRAGVDCSIPDVHKDCDMQSSLESNIFDGVKITGTLKMRLSGAQEEQKSPELGQVPEMELRTYKLVFS
ncbi:hypothetical protein BaRGS_00003225 [Batillaria attramentaria]|uniref:Alpha-mannosidase n=1 Tax=Batillaria attramentaria TaxID=370345 RepID=A0ABD0M105_9CAEN